MTSSSRVVLYATTFAHLRPAQLAHRARLRAQRALVSRLPPSVWAHRRGVVARGWPPGYEPLDARFSPGCPSPEANAGGTFRLLEEDRALGDPPDWAQPGASRLWRFHLHFFDWAWSFAAHEDRTWARRAFAELWRSWQSSTVVGRGDAWSPYVASLRAWALCGVFDSLVRGSAIEADVVDHLSVHGRFLRAHVEHDVGGNHVVKNLKALIGIGIFLGDEGLAHVGHRGLARELPIQVLDDGGHYERSPSYHCQVLGDLLDVHDLTGRAGMAAVPGITDAISGMRGWLGAMLLPDGDVALFNDCTLVGPDRVRALAPTLPAGNAGVTVLEPSGYVVVRNGRLHLVADVGPPCPPDLPAHAHADCLSFELAVDGRRVVVDTGTSTYDPGDRRCFERSTSAHNTVEVDGTDSTQVWDVFRAARLSRARLEEVVEHQGADERTVVTASHDGYRALPGRPVHRRTWDIGKSDLVVHDEVSGQGSHRLVSRLHVGPGVAVVPQGDASVVVGDATVSVSGSRIDVATSEVATGFGRRATGTVLSTRWEGELPTTLRTTVSLGGP